MLKVFLYILFILFKLIPRRKMEVRLLRRKTGLNSPVIITGRPKAVLSLLFHLFYVQ